MSDLQLIYNKETGCWERKPEPYLTLEIATQADFEELKAAVEFYKNRDKYVEQKHGRWEDEYNEVYLNHQYRCSVCKGKALYLPKENELGNLIMVQALTDYCPYCDAKMDLKP